MVCTHHAAPSWQGMTAPEVLKVHEAFVLVPPAPEFVTIGTGPSPPSCCAPTTQNPIESYCRQDGGAACAVPRSVSAAQTLSSAPVSATATRCMTAPAC